MYMFTVCNRDHLWNTTISILCHEIILKKHSQITSKLHQLLYFLNS